MKCKIEIDMGNAAFFNDDREGDNSTAAGFELARILRKLADKVENYGTPYDAFPAIDFNGNTVGKLEIID